MPWTRLFRPRLDGPRDCLQKRGLHLSRISHVSYGVARIAVQDLKGFDEIADALDSPTIKAWSRIKRIRELHVAPIGFRPVVLQARKPGKYVDQGTRKPSEFLIRLQSRQRKLCGRNRKADRKGKLMLDLRRNIGWPQVRHINGHYHVFGRELRKQQTQTGAGLCKTKLRFGFMSFEQCSGLNAGFTIVLDGGRGGFLRDIFPIDA